MKIIKYPDGTSYANIDKQLQNISFKLNTYEDLWHLNQIVDATNKLGGIPTITIPCLIDAQADRRFAEYQSSGLKLVCKFLNSMKADFKIFHPHNPEVVEALLDNVEIIDNSEFILRVLNLLNANPTASNDANIKNTILMSSDAGGFKPLMKLCDKIHWIGDTYSANKARVWDGKESILVQTIQRDNFEGRDILIIDDICIYGGTFKGLANMLRERNCGKLYLAVSHITVQNHEKDNVFNYFDRIFTTNSKYDVYYERIDGSSGKEIKNLEIIKLF